MCTLYFKPLTAGYSPFSLEAALLCSRKEEWGCPQSKIPSKTSQVYCATGLYFRSPEGRSLGQPKIGQQGERGSHGREKERKKTHLALK